MNKSGVAGLLWLFIVTAPAAVADGLPDLGDAAQNALSPQMEKRVGETVMRDIRNEPNFVDDPEITGYLNQLGHRLAAHSDGAQLDFEFFALSDPTINAFAMPGGFIGVHTGTILAAQSESELASVLAHEIGHVTQHHMARMVSSQSQAQIPTLLGMALAILAARNNPDIAMGGLVTAQAAGIQHQLNYSRDFEREADRHGLNTLERSGFDVRAMASFFERLQKVSSISESNAPGYLRTHPLTVERISDIQNRIALLPYHQVADSLDFQLVRAKIKAEEGTPRDAVLDFTTEVKERKYFSQASALYGLAVADLRAGDYAGVEHQVAELHRLKLASPLFETVAAEARLRQKDAAGAVAILRAAYKQFPLERAVVYDLVDDLLANKQPDEALRITVSDLQSYPSDARMHGLQAKTYAMLGKHVLEHRAQAEAYAAQGQLVAAIEQLQLAQKAKDGDFYVYSQIDSRLRELKARQAEEAKNKVNGQLADYVE
jgi:predicted Zn-dependent protease